MERDERTRVKQALLEAERLERAGDRPAAIAALRAALALAPEFAAAHAHIALLLQDAGDLSTALTHFARASQLRPGDARACNNFAAALNQAGRPVDAEAAARRAIAANPSYAWAHYNLGRALASQRRGAEAIDALRSAADLDASNALFLKSLGAALLDDGRLVAAERALERATSLDPSSASAWTRRGSAQLHLGNNAAAIESLVRAEALAPPDAAQIGSTRLIALHYDDSHTREEIFAAHRDWARRHAAAAPEAAFANDRDPERRLRIGYVSPRFHGASLAHVLARVLESHERVAVEVWCYASQSIEDDTTARIRSAATRFVNVVELDDDALARRMRDDRIDIAVDLAGHTPGHRLVAFARRPAPVCVSWLDYFDTTGIDAMDYLITDRWHSPEGDAQPFSERLIRLDRIRFAYTPPPDAPDPAPPPLARGSAAPVFGSFNRMTKISPRTLEAWRAALDAVPGARLIVKNSALGHEADRAYFAQRFRAHGIDPSRVEWRGYSPHAQMMAEYNDIDVVLDTFPYNGGITTLEALWMGRPVVTIAGDSLISRQSAAVLHAVGMADLIADGVAGFARTIANLAAKPAQLAKSSETSRTRMRETSICDSPGLARALEGVYRSIWRRWTAGRV